MNKITLNENLLIYPHENGLRLINPGCPNCDLFLGKSTAVALLQNIAKLGIFNINNVESDLKPLKLNKTLKKYHLTRREIEIIKHLIRGKTAREIAEVTSLSRRTVEHYVENIKFKLKVKKKSELIEKVLEVS